MKQEKIREKQLADQREARRQKNAIRKEKRVNKKLEQLGVIKKDDKKDAAAGKKDEAAPAKDQSKKSPSKKGGEESKQ